LGIPLVVSWSAILSGTEILEDILKYKKKEKKKKERKRINIVFQSFKDHFSFLK